jgi:hypothetical protein
MQPKLFVRGLLMLRSALTRILVERFVSAISWIHRNQRITPNRYKLVKVNLGCGLSVAPGWLNIDGSLNAWVANKSNHLLPIAYRLGGAKKFYPKSFYCTTLRENIFIHHNFSYGIPLINPSC